MPKVSTTLEKYLGIISSYERDFKKWETRSEKILKRYRDDDRTADRTDNEVRFNILWSNVQTLVPATYSKTPQAAVSRRFKDNDPVGRVSSLILERSLDYEIQNYPDFRSTMKACVYDRFLGGRGTAWARYEPHIKAVQEQLPQDGAEITEDVDEPGEELDYECAPVDYVHWKDFGHAFARTWEEVPIVWRKVYMQMPAKEERFPKKAEKIPKDSRPTDDRYPNQKSPEDGDEGSWVYELWDKEEKKAFWFHKKMKDVLDERDDPLGLQDFFPCPKPLYATLTNESLVPVPDFSLYQDQARSLDTLADRIYGLINMLQVKGVYDASQDKSLGRLFTEGRNGVLLPVKNWAAFAEKNGLKGSIDIADLDPIARALKEAYTAFAQVVQFVYQITGIADIVRGVTDPNETLGAQEIKKNFVGLRLGDMKMGVALFASQLIQLKAQIMVSKFSPETLLKFSAADQLSPEDQQLIPQAMALLIGPERMTDPDAQAGPNPMRSFRIEVEADSLVQIDEQEEKTNRMELMTAFGTFLEKGSQVVMVAPQAAPLIVEVGKYVFQSFKVGKNVEGTFDTLLDQLNQQAKNPVPPKPDPEMAKVEAQKQADQAKLQMDGQKMQQESQLKVQEQQASMQLERQKHADQMVLEREKLAMEQQREDARFQQECQQQERQFGLEEKKHEDDRDLQKGKLRTDAAAKGVDPDTMEIYDAGRDPKMLLMDKMVESNQQTQQRFVQAIEALVQVAKSMQSLMGMAMAPRESELIRDPRSGKPMKSISRVVRQ